MKNKISSYNIRRCVRINVYMIEEQLTLTRHRNRNNFSRKDQSLVSAFFDLAIQLEFNFWFTIQLKIY